MKRHWLIFILFFLVGCQVASEDPMGGYNPLNTMNVMGVQGSDTGGVGVNTPMTIGDTSQTPGPQYTIKKGAGPITVRFFVNGGGQAGNPPVTAHALIIASVGGNQIQRVVTVGQGTAITLAAEKVSVYFYDVTSQLSNPPSRFNGLKYSIFTHIVEGLRSDFLTPPTLLNVPGGPIPASAQNEYFVPGAGGGNTVIPVPNGCGINAVFIGLESATSPKNAHQPLIVEAMGSNNVLLFAWDPYNVTGYVQLPPGTTQLKITSDTSATAITNVFPVWGIEG